jgi:hypothetical protein
MGFFPLFHQVRMAEGVDSLNVPWMIRVRPISPWHCRHGMILDFYIEEVAQPPE